MNHNSRQRVVATWLVVAAGTYITLRFSGWLWGGFLVINTSPSLPAGIYVRCDTAPQIGSLVEFQPPEKAVEYAQFRWGSEPAGITFLKPVVAVAGDFVDGTGEWLKVNGVPIAPIVGVDSEGNPLPRWLHKRKLRAGELFVLSTYNSRSFDSRNFGPIGVNDDDYLGVRKPLLCW